jgi:hypothetical protein
MASHEGHPGNDQQPAMPEPFELRSTPAGEESSLINPLFQTPEKKNPLDDEPEADTNFDIGLETEVGEEDYDASVEMDDSSSRLWSSSPPLPFLSRDSFNNGSEASETLPDLSGRGSSGVLRNISQENGETLTTAVSDARLGNSIILPGYYEDLRFIQLPRGVSMAEFIGNEDFYVQQDQALQDRLNQLSANTANNDQYPSGGWQPETPSHRVQYPELAEAASISQNLIFLTGHNLVNNEQTLETGYQFSGGADLQYQTPSGAGLYGTLAANNSNYDVEHMLSDAYDPREFDDSIDQSSPTLSKQCRRKKVSDRLDLARLEYDTVITQPHEGFTWPSNSQSSPPAVASAERENRQENLSREELSTACTSYVSENLYPPSLESADVLPRHSQPSTKEKTWLDQQIARKEKRDAAEGFNSPNALLYDPLGDLTPQNEKHEAARCRRAAELIFEQYLTGQSDWYDHEMVGVYHFIPKSETDKWHDDSNFLITDKEFEELVDSMDDGKEEHIEPPQNDTTKAVENVTMENTSTASTNDVNVQPEKETEPSSKEVMVHHPVPLDQAVKQSENIKEQGTIREQAVERPINQTESLIEKETVLKRFHSLTPTGEPKRKVARLDTTPMRSLGVLEPLGSAESRDSFETACESPQAVRTNLKDEPLPIPSFHTERPSTPTPRTSRLSKGRKARHRSEEKTTKNVFAVVEDRLEQVERRSPMAPPSGTANWRGPPPSPRPLQPPPIGGYPTREPQYYVENAYGSPDTPKPSSGGRSISTSSFVPAPLHNQSMIPQSTAPNLGPTMGTFYPNPDSYGQQPHQLCGNEQYDFTASYVVDIWGNRVGDSEQMGYSQASSNVGPGHSSHFVANNRTQHAMQQSVQGPIEHHHRYTGDMQLHRSQVSFGNRSSDSTISETSRPNSSQGLPRLVHQPETPSKGGEISEQILSGSGHSPISSMNLGQRVNSSVTRFRSDPSTLGIFDSTPIKFNLPPPASKSAAREKAVVTFRGHKECAKAHKVLEYAAKATPEKKIMFTETFEDKPTTIILSGPAGNNIRGWVKKLLPYAQVEMSMT